MPDEPAPAFTGPRPSMATHWPAPPGGWQRDGISAPPATEPAETSGRSADIGAVPPSPPERRRPKYLPVIISVIAGLVVAGLMAGVAVATVASVRRYRQDRKLAAVGMDQPVRDGAFQFTADGVRCGVREIGPPDDYQAPTGQFCVITLSIKNVGTTPAVFADAIQKAYGPGGVWFSSDSQAGFYANPDPMIFFNDINPGNKVKALVVYDIPPSERILRLEVHENPTTRGAIINIS